MALFVSFNGDTVWWNTDLFDRIDIGYGKYGFRNEDGSKPRWGEAPVIQGVRKCPHPTRDHKETIIFTHDMKEQECKILLEKFNRIIEEIENKKEISFEDGDTYDNSDLFHKIELIRLEQYDGHNGIHWTEYEILGRFTDINNSRYNEKRHEWYGSELLYSSQRYGKCEEAAKTCHNLITVSGTIL